MSDFTMPSLGADMERGTLVEWLVKPGSKVRSGDIIAVVETHKGAIDVEIFEDATVSEICAHEGETVPVGGLLARLEAEGGKAAPLLPATKPEPAPAAAKAAPEPTFTITRTGRTKVSPAARRLAAQIGIDPETLTGTGVDGSVSLADVELARASAAKPAPAAKAARKRGFDPVEMRRGIALAMARSKREIPHYYLSSTVDMGPTLDWLARFNEARPPTERMLAAVPLIKATALALRKHPQLNGFWQDDAFQPGAGVHIGWAISLRGGGLVSPAIHDADTLALPDLMDKLRDLVARARSGGLRSSELMDATVTITSLGERGADNVAAIIYPPQVAIVGFGRIRERPWIVDGKVAARPLVDVTLAADHRASDGHTGGLLLSTIEQLLQEPETL
ncbi:dihydrolipoamide acetyltransferase family protein [Novosphingobium mangrovi (ex Huang et al. 2023)]|uniref:Dihydrolipoamide acetyltransferase component of pyruvate dehydrogenase complex n=1 Tax=Novosphingobium mangrovi (ex Huang et al. 2023) TaxID=2976432 RepID=A0ABT2I0K1_9SPHN|nr:dihydrolipoamide acetyltransferase family protein [Novosphingobium mangrovi (ex Huang et al. 2023)]MCT2398329.1 2-oxo acid dehydrogenase subunit E2 [Novosphingobium mangrovi (ex Huang et al. 2023)]